MSKMKTTVNLSYATYNKADKVRKLLGIDNFSNFIEFVLKKHCSDPEEIIKLKMKEHQQKLMYYKDILDSVLQQKVEIIVSNPKESKMTERQFR